MTVEIDMNDWRVSSLAVRKSLLSRDGIYLAVFTTSQVILRRHACSELYIKFFRCWLAIVFVFLEDMSQRNGTGTAQSTLTQPTTSDSLPPDNTPRRTSSDGRTSLNLSLDTSLEPDIHSKTVKIPRLSSATAELLARVTGSIQEEKRDGYSLASENSVDLNQDSSSASHSGESGKMKVSSVFMDLPTPPFASSKTSTVSDTNQKAATPSQESLELGGLVHTASEKAEPSTSLLQTEAQSTSIAQIASSANTTDERQDESNVSPSEPHKDTSKPTKPIFIAPKPVETPAPQPQIQVQPTPPPAQTAESTPSASSASSISEQKNVPIAPIFPPENHSQPAELVPIAPKADETPSSSTPQLQSHSSFTTPIAPTPSTLTLKYRGQKKPPVPPHPKLATHAKRGRKRKRGKDKDEGVVRAGDSSSDESDITPMATQTKSGRQVNRPRIYAPSLLSPGTGKGISNASSPSANPAAPAPPTRKRRRVFRKGKEINVNCKYCQRGHSPLNNAIVFCDHCNKAWHQLCHDPPIEDEVITVKEKEWLCRECKPVPTQVVQPTVVQSNPVVKAQPLGPPIHPPLPMPQTEVGGEGFSRDERRSYLSSLSHATLVELLVSLSDRNPSMPMFPTNLKSLPSSKFSHQSTKPAASPDIPASGLTAQPPNISSNQASQVPLNPFPNPLPSASGRHNESADESEYEEVEDHRLYPRAGNGFRLPLNDTDLDILQEDPACPTFSYSLHGSAKTRAETNEAAPVWGAT